MTVTSDGIVNGGTIGLFGDTSWTETTLTYNNRPSILSTVAGAPPPDPHRDDRRIRNTNSHDDDDRYTDRHSGPNLDLNG